MNVKDLRGNPKNPRTVTDEKLTFLKKSLAEFGDLSGIVFNRKTKFLIGGHQRKDVFPKDSKLVIEKKYSKPTKVGTVAEGYIVANGERHSYREVEWDKVKEKAANIAANKGAGDWDQTLLGEWMKELEGFGFDLDLTMFNEDERLPFFAESNFEPGTEGDQGKLDTKNPITCPHCGEDFIPGEEPKN